MLEEEEEEEVSCELAVSEGSTISVEVEVIWD